MKLAAVILFSFCIALASATPACIEQGVFACIGSSDPCRPCYERPGVTRLTVEKAVIDLLNQKLVARDYSATAPLFAPNVELLVPAFGGAFHGVQEVVGYFFLGDPNVSDTYELLSSTKVTDTQEDLRVLTAFSQDFKSVQTGNVFNQQAVWSMQFNSVHQISYWVIYPDSLAVANNLLGSLDLNLTSVCIRIQNDCTGNLQQFASVSDCITKLSALPPIDPTYGLSTIAAQYSYGCRSFHEILARTDPQIHCPHVGLNMTSPLATPCFNWQDILP